MDKVTETREPLTMVECYDCKARFETICVSDFAQFFRAPSDPPCPEVGECGDSLKGRAE